ncbi:MAG: DUF3326 domain-containing protein [Verrucomicrobia bacterium]|nr:DUF3326 domain-containing protein [Verrucomicrobiota bacterium]
MSIFLSEKEFDIPAAPRHRDLLSHIPQALKFRLADDAFPVRFVITRSDREHYHCEVGALTGIENLGFERPEPIFRFVRRSVERTDTFNAVFLVPTGIGAEIGGHAGDAMPVARLLAEACDVLVTHPNVLNASDINETPANAFYVEGSVICRLLMGTVGLQPVRANRVLVVIDKHDDELFVNAAVNAVSAARASYGLHCSRVIQLDPPVKLKSRYTDSGRAGGETENLDYLFRILEDYRDEYDAVAISSVVDVPHSYHQDYFDRQGEMVNPWGGVEAMLTHAISSLFNVPAAHAPMFESRDIANADPGIVEPRMAAEAVSLTFMQCILKGTQRTPRIVVGDEAIRHPGVLDVSGISCLVIPDGCLGLPTLAALEQGIPVIAVKENQNLMQNDLAALPWAPGQLRTVENYWEAVGVMSALRAGIAPESVRRPLGYTRTEVRSRDKDMEERESGDQTSGAR